MLENDTQRRTALRAVVREHIERFPDAGDTASGIVASWMPETGYDDATRLIEGVLDDMVECGELRRVLLPDGTHFFTRGTAHHEGA